MRVYELMDALSNSFAGNSVEVAVCLTKEDLMNGENIGDGVFSLILKATDVDDGFIIAEVKK